MKLDDHPTVRSHRERCAGREPHTREPLDPGLLREACLEAGADDAGAVPLTEAALGTEAEAIRASFPAGRTAVSLVCRLNPESVRSLSRSTSDLEYLHAIKRLDAAAHALAARLGDRGIRAFTPASGFPMDVERWPDRMWPVSHKLVAEAAGMGVRGKNRLLLHPRFGGFVALGSVIIDADLTAAGEPLGYNPCLECGLCTAVCPVGAVAADGAFGFTACLTHNYRDRLGGFSQWVEEVVSSRDAFDYRRRVSDPETMTMWQALSYGISNKCTYCVAVCPAGEEHIGPYLENRAGFVSRVVKPLQERAETVYVIRGSDGEAHLSQHFPHKRACRTGTGIRAGSVRGFIAALPLAFNRGRARGLTATYHLTFTGEEPLEVTVVIDDGTLAVAPGHRGAADLRLTADGRSWLRFLAGELGLFRALVGGSIRIRGAPSLMKRFAACFPL